MHTNKLLIRLSTPHHCTSALISTMCFFLHSGGRLVDEKSKHVRYVTIFTRKCNALPEDVENVLRLVTCEIGACFLAAKTGISQRGNHY